MTQELLHLGAHETLRVVALSPDELHIEATWDPGSDAPIAHLHPAQDEQFKVLAGTLTAVVGGEQRELRTGDTLSVPRGTPHKMWNAGAEEASASWRVLPAGRTLDFFREIDRLRAGGTQEPAVEGLIAAVTEYADVFVPVMDG